MSILFSVIGNVDIIVSVLFAVISDVGMRTIVNAAIV